MPSAVRCGPHGTQRKPESRPLTGSDRTAAGQEGKEPCEAAFAGDRFFLFRLLLPCGLCLNLASCWWPRLKLQMSTRETVTPAPRLRKADVQDEDVSDENDQGKWLQGQATRCRAEPSPCAGHSALGLWKCLASPSTLTDSDLRLTGQQGEAHGTPWGRPGRRLRRRFQRLSAVGGRAGEQLTSLPGRISASP